MILIEKCQLFLLKDEKKRKESYSTLTNFVIPLNELN